ncbi:MULTISPECIES: 7-cyano-7-deazaguanine synthase QueC [unclassified Microcoleus]|uniref:7-cyano-7-deazaguanine synthase QueC n=1 Tax=unclassified Microcoleus TaxID=2642155 RepID=UPI001D4CA553|nr:MULTISPECIES: 7-cyano-7-deazaguanine synthase QueC [unclassified Microcoleus]MCC3442560.1 7-cyano-7-deazaguanine synthase QueC [Microcoleus sp. PH2017_03_ELD_O_A]MCC3503321.1 7-cyano-7-deazaguanine synthase QueC [Microcoleus sp. PH2017_19_SFW_U_A]TAE13439.1 MAG: 7-cyano-7-deazaguanine synthase QueC [Oscillatoriales cyanobacterium]MCC3474155.1 7-cyano-7-deazaguanine synthase QueC [Microcoleus sp. PH2017_13_LAR_U_A]MCC3486638.1 7-cyano-7-deazaguanine synthase QueC [Microcoleus sp. PH2017_14_L
MKAVILLSGGLDSSTVLYQAKADGCECYAISFDYQQRHRRELESARAIALSAQVKVHQVVNFDLTQWGGSALTDNQIELPIDRNLAEMSQNIPVTYVPARNTIFLSFALAYAETLGAQRIYIGVNALDYSGYPDCRLDYIQAMQEVFRLGTKQGREGEAIKIFTPLIELKKTEIIQLGNKLGVPWTQTWSCYSGGESACGVCDSCRLRLAAFDELGLKDPVPYA